MSSKIIEKIYTTYGVGTRKDLSSSQVKSLQRLLKPLCKKLSEYCANYALCQCMMYAVGNEVHMDFVATNINGDYKDVSFAVDLETKEMYNGTGAERLVFNVIEKGKEVDKEKEVCDCTYDTIVGLMNLVPLPVGMISFPVSGKISNVVSCEYKMEKGTVLFILDDAELEEEDFLDQLLNLPKGQ